MQKDCERLSRRAEPTVCHSAEAGGIRRWELRHLWGGGKRRIEIATRRKQTNVTKLRW